MAKPETVTGWKLPEVERELLLGRFPPRYENVVADHVTLRVGATANTPLPHEPDGAKVVGRADDGNSLATTCFATAVGTISKRRSPLS